MRVFICRLKENRAFISTVSRKTHGDFHLESEGKHMRIFKSEGNTQGISLTVSKAPVNWFLFLV